MSMNRREFTRNIAGLAGAGAVVGTAAAAAAPVGKFGRLTVSGHSAHKHATGEDLHVYLDGVDVTQHSYLADDCEGVVEMFCRDEQHHRDWTAKGAIHVNKGNDMACRLRLTGRVEITPGQPLQQQSARVRVKRVDHE